jgi:hypothetical protein
MICEFTRSVLLPGRLRPQWRRRSIRRNGVAAQHREAATLSTAVVNPGDPIDMSKRLDGTPSLRFPPRLG